MMKTNTVSVFIGSSFKLMSYRHHIGNCLRQLNDKWEQQGVRLYLKRWEDFRTEYESASKQQEYIEELALPSNICAFFFRDEIGKYTERELDACLAHNHQNVLCYRVPDYDGLFCDEVKTQLAAKGLTAVDVRDETELAQDLMTRVENHILHENMTGNAGVALSDSYWFYTTIPDDNAKERDLFGTTIRSLDDFCEAYLGARCRLHPMHQKNLLAQTHHYTPYLFAQTSAEDLEEFETALTLQEGKGMMKSITLFTKSGGKLRDKNADIKNLIDKRDLFFCNVRDADTIRWRLMSWVMRQENLLLSADFPGIKMENGCLYLNGRPMVSMATLDDSGKAATLLKEIELTGANIDTLLKKVSTPDNDRNIAALTREKNLKLSSLHFLVSECITRAIFEQYEHGMNGQQPLDFDKLEELVVAAASGLDSLEQQKEKILGTLQVNVQIVNERIKEVGGNVRDNKQAEELRRLAEIREKLTRQLVYYGSASPQQLLSTQLFLVAVHDTYLHPNIATAEEDAVFRRILNDARQFDTDDIQVEIIRMNYANSFLRKEEYKKAIFLLREAIENIEKMESEAWYVLRTKTTFYLRAYSAYHGIGDKKGMGEILSYFRKHIDRCMAIDSSFIADKAIYLSALLTYLNPDEDKEEREIKEAMRVADWIDQNLDMSVDDYWFGDIFIQLPNMIAGYLIDHRVGKRPEVIDQMNNLALHFLDMCERNALNLMRVNLVEALFYRGEVNHQKGFLYYNMGVEMWHLSEQCYAKSLASKKRLMKLEENYSLETNYAQTLVNWGAVKESWMELIYQGLPIQMPGEEAEAMAQEALDIYGRHRQKGNIASDLHYYEALQLLGTMHFHRGKIGGNSTLIERGLAELTECWQWNLLHPDNDYHRVFENNAGEILKEEGVWK